MAIASKEAPAELWQILAAADAIDHSLPLDEELHGAFVRLSDSKHIEEFYGRFKVGSGVPDPLKPLLLRSTTNCMIAESILASEPRPRLINVGDSRNQVRYPSLTSEKIREADKRYRRWLRDESNKADDES
ncbi:MAG TPA: hypothetical protein VJB15_11905 [Rhodothermia bacterium]|nr:hypothetical protein [Rhodothermia bacterium]